MDNATRKGSGGKPPISAHPAFPAVVALWFAALLGIGSLILPVRLYETVLTATGISSIITSAAPPLGFTARALIALVATVSGAGLGYILARKLTAGKNASYAAERADSGHRALNPVEDLDEDDFDDDLPPIRELPQTTGRRRALAIEEEDGISELLNVAPLPGADVGGSAAFDIMEADVFESNDADAPDDDAFELSQEIVEDEPDFSEPNVESEEPVQSDAEAAPPVTISKTETSDAPHSAMPEPLPFSPPSLQRSQTEEHAPAHSDGPRLFDTPEAADDSESDARMPETPDLTPIPSEEPVSENAFTPDAMPPSAPSLDEAQPDPFAAAQVEAQDEGLVQLVQKLGSTLEKHREWSARRAAERASMPAVVAPVAQPEPSEPEDSPAEAPIAPAFDAAGADDAAEAMAAYFSKPAAAPEVALDDGAKHSAEPETPRAFDAPKQVFQPTPEPDAVAEPVNAPAPAPGQTYAPMTGFAAASGFGEDEDDAEDLTASFQLPITPRVAEEPAQQAPASPRPAFDVPPTSRQMAEAAPEEQPTHASSARDADYSALAANNPFKSNAEDFVRIDEPEPETAQPAVVFPNQQTESGQLPAGASPASNDDNERALREALMNLQRMGK